MIEVSGLTKRFRDRTAVEGLSFTIPRGEVVGLLGPNGAGKTTTLRLLTGYLPATSGSVRVAGFDVFEEPRKARRHIGYLPELPPLYDAMTVRGQLRFAAELKGLGRSLLPAEVERVSRLTGVDGVLDRLTSNLSKGFRQRVGIAQALLGDPDEAGRNPVSSRSVVVFPAPFGPSRPTTSPRGMSKVRSSTAVRSRKRLVSPLTSIITPSVRRPADNRVRGEACQAATRW